MDLETLKGEVCGLLHLKDDSLVDIVCATYVANLLEGDPLWTMIVGPPSSGKTETLMALRDCDGVHIISSLTANTLVSGWQVGHGEKKSHKGEESSLLEQLKGKMLITKDFTSILSLRPDSQKEILGQLREIYDGYYKKSWGTGKTYIWDSSMGFLGGCTEEIYQKHYLMTELGPRFVYYHLENTDIMAQSLLAFEMQGKERAIRLQLRKSFREFLHAIPRGNVDLENEEEWKIPFTCIAALTATARAPVPRSQGRKVLIRKPNPEGPGRVIKQFKKLAIALARVHGIRGISKETFHVVRKTAIDSIPDVRWGVLQYLWDESQDTGKYVAHKGGDFEKAMRMPHATVTYILEDLVLLGLIDKERQDYILSDVAIAALEGCFL